MQIQVIWLTTIDRIPTALPPEQENLVAAIWSSIDSPMGEATPTIHRGLGMLDRFVGFSIGGNSNG